ncbi:MAG: hypothetical protein IPN48_14220 [Sphingomonadales bacterium]|nr:hypothetical protein [Sphingomonadales bacterium]
MPTVFRINHTWSLCAAIPAISTIGKGWAPTGWSYDDVLPLLQADGRAVSETNEAVISREVRGNAGPVGVGHSFAGHPGFAGLRQRSRRGRYSSKAIKVTAQVVTTSVASLH